MKQPDNMQQVAWREYLRTLIEAPAEKQRAAKALGVSELTLTRWATSEIEPRPGSLKRLPSVFPSHEQRLAELIREAYDPSRANPSSLLLRVIPSEFSARVLAVLARTTGTLVPSAICNLVLRQALEHLDPDLLGMEITVVQCTPPLLDFPVRSLFEWIGAGTLPWSKGIGRRLLFLGAESLCGHVVETGEPEIIQNTERESLLLPVRSYGYEKSVAVYPLLKRGKIAGGFRVSSSQCNFFTPECTDIVEQYANLIALAYYDEQFYRAKAIRLEVMIPTNQQQHYTTSFRQRVLERKKISHLGEIDAEVCVIQEIEQMLLQNTIDSQESGESAYVQRP